METNRVRRIIFSRFALLSLGCIGALALVMSFVLSSLLTQAASEWEWENTAALVRREVRMSGLEGVFAAPGSPEDRERWGRTFSSLLTSLPEVVRAKVWDNQATILWSDESHLIGRQFLDNDELRDALTGKLEVEIKSLTKAEHGYERPAFTTLAEIYVPIFSSDGRVLGVVEVYKTPERLLATIRRGRIAVWSISFAGALLLYLVMHPLLTLVYRKEVQEETLRAETGRLEIEVAERTTQLFQAQKMEAVGLLAGGIAHDFNNLLTVILGRAQLLLRGRPADDPLAQGLALIDMTAQRAAALTRQLLAFSRKQVLQRRVLNLNSVVAEMEKMLRPLIGEHLALVTVLDPALGPVNADPGQLEQVILNLAVNARDAMPQGGQIVLKTANVQLDAATAARQSGLQAGGYAVLAVSDTGVGMDPTTQARIFEPFFTTKEPGKGTGLGLSTVYGIVQQHSGFVSVESAAGLGTTFKIHMPHVEAVAEAPVAGHTLAASSRGSATVLVVEDEDEVRALAIEILRGEGYTTLAAGDGAEALRVAARHPGPLHLLLTDVVMPHVDGWELARQLSAVRPDTKVLYMTGYSEVAVAHEGVSDAIVLQKPFTPDILASRVRETIQAVKIAG
jgi:signal transduction histidine kinase/ActR/RegA family two-component response regulator